MTGNMGHKSREKNCLLQECVQNSRVDRDDSATHHEVSNDARTDPGLCGEGMVGSMFKYHYV